MRPRRPRKLIESAMPVAAMNAAGRAEKAVPRPGVPATMHIWWSRKPIGLARAVLFASIVDDPLDRPDQWPAPAERKAEHQRRLDLVADLARWDCPPERIDEAQQLVARECGDDPPRVIDPFCGGGAIPLGAARLGLEADAADLNPVAALITKALVEIPAAVAGLGPVHPAAPSAGAASTTEGLAADVAAYGNQLLAEVQSRIGSYYPPVDGEHPVSYLWARTGTCANPTCGSELPLLSSWWLRKATGAQWHVAPIQAAEADARPGLVGFEVRQGAPPADLVSLKIGKGANYRCLQCGEVTSSEGLREQSRRGELGLRLVAIQTFADPERPKAGRAWVSADDEQAKVALAAWPAGRKLPLPDVALPIASGNMGGFGIDTIEKLLTPRQRLLMVTMCQALHDLREEIKSDARRAHRSGDPSRSVENDDCPLRDGGSGPRAYAEAVTTYLALAISRMANRVSTMTVHNRANGSVEQSFIQLGFAFYGDFPEANPFSGSTGSFTNSLDHVVATVAALPVGPPARVSCGPATGLLQGHGAGGSGTQRPGIVCTDPPYYDMLDHSTLSNLFYPWLRLALRDVWPEETSGELTPDAAQMVPNHRRFDLDKLRAHEHFEAGLRETVAALRQAQRDDFPLTLYYGYQQTQRRKNGHSSNAWEVLLSALVDAGFQVISTWPLRTERPEGVKTGSRSLASSILLACRARPLTATTAPFEQFVTELHDSVHTAVRTLQAGNIAPVDLTQSAIGPGLVIYSSYAQVLDADGDPMSVGDALEHIHRTIDEVIASTDAGSDPETRWAIAWFGARGLQFAEQDKAEHLAAASDTSVSRLIETGIVVVQPGKVRLRGVDELTLKGNAGPSVWGIAHRVMGHLAAGEREAATNTLVKLDSTTASAVKALAYRLFLICHRRGWTAEAVAASSIVQTWPKLAEGAPTPQDV